jgi:hypothetical protein
MPIRREHRFFYTIDWCELSAVIRFERAKGRWWEAAEGPVEGKSLERAFQRAKQSNRATPGRPLSLNKPEQGGKNDTMSS